MNGETRSELRKKNNELRRMVEDAYDDCRMNAREFHLLRGAVSEFDVRLDGQARLFEVEHHWFEVEVSTAGTRGRGRTSLR